jgi:histidinol-phosphate/aromatic aminotransferase/cobyric acid decarboxylase-like protein
VELVGYERARQVIDFCFIANPYYPTPTMIEQLKEQFATLIKSYPSSRPTSSRAHLAAVLHVDPEHLLIGNGATELITLINETLIERIAVPVPTFSEYLETLDDRRAAELYRLEPENDYALDPEHYLRWIHSRRLRAALVINPGNPTGQLLSLDAMRAFLRAARDLELIIVDESFIDFAGDPIPSLLADTDRFTNLLIVRSMSKHCGVPGLRLGYACTGNLYLLNRLRRVIPTWNINTIAEYFLSQLPATDADYHRARLQVIDDVRWLWAELARLPQFHVYPTGANFVLVGLQGGMTAREFQMKLLHDHHMYVRDCSNKVGMDHHHIRIASQGRAKDARLVEVLKTLCG